MHLCIAYKVVAFTPGYILRFEADLKNYTTELLQARGKFCDFASYFPKLLLLETSIAISNLM